MPDRLKNYMQIWRSIGASQFILDVIDNGYRIPFHYTPPPSFLRNNKSALAHSSFVEEAISELLLTNRVLKRTSYLTMLIPCPFPSSPQGRNV